MWDVGERGFLPAMDPVKDLPAPWDELVKIMDYVPSFSVQGRGLGVFKTAQRFEASNCLKPFFSKRKNDTLQKCISPTFQENIDYKFVFGRSIS